MTGFISGAITSTRKVERRTALLSACGLLSGGVGFGQPSVQPVRRILSEITLPSPQTTSKLTLEEVLARRRSVRRFAPQALAVSEIGQLMWAGQGITDAPRGFRTAPSAGALYPLELYAVTPYGLYHYVPRGHRLQRLGMEDLRRALAKAAADQDCVGEASLDIVVAGVLERTAVKYGERAEQYILLEAGHAAQNILLEATALGLGGVAIGAMYEDQLAELLSFPEEEEPLYVLALGHPR